MSFHGASNLMRFFEKQKHHLNTFILIHDSTMLSIVPSDFSNP
ncbi:hypothetical protein RT41_GL001210 [Lactococcus fujiensis JCM 16395]|uniref:Uncharacterized protein n=1 Tax=Lactococcus fujiensis JCM 16395 TaxID=1291764 RepID=A0A2A5RM10_9LACT|nr:hypothetical protein RT41_GL001210 [Lactococcus fujiensis JCM 16395]